jgi:cobyrinic acid a,c-diamide synthase
VRRWQNGSIVVLVVDARSMARSAAALIYGFRHFDPEIGLAGVIFNRIGSAGHLEYHTEAKPPRSRTFLSWAEFNTRWMHSGRHLGLVGEKCDSRWQGVWDRWHPAYERT